MIFRWFLSKTVRDGLSVHKHYRRLLLAQCDLLSPQARASVQAKLDELREAISSGPNGRVKLKVEELESAALKSLKPYPHAAWRENVEVLLVALAVALGIRTFFLQPFKIPTGSMQPTLFGVTSQNLLQYPDFKIPGGLERFKEWFAGKSYVHVVAQNDGTIDSISPMTTFLIFNIKQSFTIGGVEHTIWFPPDFGDPPQDMMGNKSDPLAYRAGWQHGQYYHKGDDVVKLLMNAGDHLFVDRFTLNFRKPIRGEILVFATAGTKIRDQDEFYVKRLTVLPNERVQIGDDRHMRINGERIDAGTPHFENLYGFDPSKPTRDSQYSGHINGTVAEQCGIPTQYIAPLFPDETSVYTNGPDTYMFFGDNTCGSSDSRIWGTVPTQNIVGRTFFVYWPITSRFGWGNN